MPFDDPSRINEIIGRCCKQYRKGTCVTHSQQGVAHYWLMPHENETQGELLDVHFVKVSVDETAANELRDELVQLLSTNPRMRGGPSYIEIGVDLGHQGLALMLLALGKALKLWDIITPATLGISGAEADELAWHGFVMCSGMRAA
jgi:hypothetical protein